MPELPDVEGFREVIGRHAAGQRIERVEVTDAGVLRGVTARQLADRLHGHRFGKPERHGKWLIARTDGPTVLMHFGMTGGLEWHDVGAPRPRPDYGLVPPLSACRLNRRHHRGRACARPGTAAPLPPDGRAGGGCASRQRATIASASTSRT